MGLVIEMCFSMRKMCSLLYKIYLSYIFDYFRYHMTLLSYFINYLLLSEKVTLVKVRFFLRYIMQASL